MFSEQRLDLGYDYGTVATITTKTTVIERGNGTEQRTVDWQQPLLTFSVGQYSTINEQLETFIAFHRARKGALEGFRFKDWSDYLINSQFLANGDGNLSEFQLYKTYSVNGWVAHRPITKPVENTVRIFKDAVEVTEGWSIDTTTGILSFEEAPTGEIRFSCEFDVPVRFATDEIRLRFEALVPSTGNKIYNWENLTLQEVRLPHGTIPNATIPQDLNHQIDLGYDYGTIGGAKFSTRIESMASGQEVRSSNWASPKAQWEIGQRSLIIQQLEYLISLFRVARGRAVRFRYLDRSDGATYSVRFGEDAIAFRFDAYERGTGRVIFNLSGMPLVGLPIIPNPPTLTNTGYGTGWDRPVSNNSYGWNGAGDSISKWLTFPGPAPAKTGDNFDWIVTYSFNSPLDYYQKARFQVDNQLMAVRVNNFQVTYGPIGGFPFWTEIELFIPAGEVVVSFAVRNVAPGEPLGFQPFNPTGFRLEWI